jgi:hypothetical protein
MNSSDEVSYVRFLIAAAALLGLAFGKRLNQPVAYITLR